MFNLERDPNLVNLEYNVFQNLMNIKREEDTKNGYTENNRKGFNTIRFVSVEDAIKELIEMEKNLK